jgi:very-short-patch-repair endonuclease
MKNDTWKSKSLFPYWDLPKNKELTQTARKLRKQGILSEVVFWNKFKNIDLLKYDIDRQVIIGNYIVDFFIAEIGLVIEIDGSTHNDKIGKDKLREEYLESHDLKVIRISDKDVLHKIDKVYVFIQNCILERVDELKSIHPVCFAATPQ